MANNNVFTKREPITEFLQRKGITSYTCDKPDTANAQIVRGQNGVEFWIGPSLGDFTQLKHAIANMLHRVKIGTTPDGAYVAYLDSDIQRNVIATGSVSELLGTA